MRIRVMIVHQSGFFLQDGNYFILADKSRILYLRFEIIPRDIAVIIGNKAVGNIHLLANKFFECRETTLCQFAVELITAFGRGCSAEGYFNDIDCTVLAYIPQELHHLLHTDGIVRIGGVYDSTVHTEVNADFRVPLLRMRNTYTKQQENQRYTIFLNAHKSK